MKLEKKIDTLAELAGINISDNEREGFVKDMESILAYVEQLQDMEVDRKEFSRTEIDGDNYREDSVKPASGSERDIVLENFPVKTADDLLEAHGVLEHKL